MFSTFTAVVVVVAAVVIVVLFLNSFAPVFKVVQVLCQSSVNLRIINVQPYLFHNFLEI